MKKIIIIIVVLLIVVAAAIFALKYNPLVERSDGQLYVSDTIKITSLLIGGVVESPLEVVGEARGSWYFEAVFPVWLLDGNGNEIARAQAQAQSEWTTNDFVPFKATLTFTAPTTEAGTLVLHNDNPSGLPQNDREVRIPVKFSR